MKSGNLLTEAETIIKYWDYRHFESNEAVVLYLPPVDEKSLPNEIAKELINEINENIMLTERFLKEQKGWQKYLVFRDNNNICPAIIFIRIK